LPTGIAIASATKVSKSAPDAKETAPKLDTWRGFPTKYGVDSRRLWSANFRLRTLGFTLVELVVVLVLLAIVSAVAVPSLSGTRAIDDVRFVHEVRDALRFAQRTAVAQRRNVCVNFTSSSVSLTIAAAAGGACTDGLSGPGGESPFVVNAASTGFTTLPSNFSFDPLGAASVGQTLALSGATVAVDAVTGYVR
jgi:MSHA pilin protein MshC